MSDQRIAKIVDSLPVDVTPTVRGDAIAWAEVRKRDQAAYPRDYKVHAVAVVVDRNDEPKRHDIYELDGKYWASGIYKSTPVCADTVEEVQAMVAEHYDYRAAWEEYMTKHPPPTIQSSRSGWIRSSNKGVPDQE